MHEDKRRRWAGSKLAFGRALRGLTLKAPAN